MLFEERPEFGEQVYNRGELKLNCFVSDTARLINYLRSIGKSEDDIKEYVSKLYSKMFETKWHKVSSKYYEMAISYANKRYSNIPYKESLYIPNAVLEEIHKIGDPASERVIFITYCVYKYYECNIYSFYTTDEMIEGFARSKLSNGVLGKMSERNDNIFDLKMKTIRIKGTPTPTLHIVLSDKLLSLQDSNGITITNFVNLPMYYDRWAGNGKFYICQNCGAIQKMNKNCKKPTKYCRVCAKKINIQKTAERRKNKCLI